jgi:hypothetical protein
MRTFKPLVVLLFILFSLQGKAQVCDSIADQCLKHLPPFISDGQNYRALVLEDEIAEFNGTFFGGSTYRIAACSGVTEGSLVFSIYDKDRNLLYTNEKYKNAPYWDFKFKSTMDCIIEAKLDKSKQLKSGCAVMLIGFKSN